VGHSPRVPHKEGRRSSLTMNFPNVILVTLLSYNSTRTLITDQETYLLGYIKEGKAL
jgi:hypothetical protein